MLCRKRRSSTRRSWRLSFERANELSQVPVLIPLRLPQYCFVHFNYVTSVGVIGYTMPALARPPQDVAVLWHEVAGYSVARARGGKLQNWARNLRTALMAEPCSPDSERTSGDTAWDWYRDSFMTSKLDRIPVRLRISSDDNRSRLAVDTSKKIRDYFTIKRQEDAAVYAGAAQPEYVENDNAWQTDWLGEFIEDLYGIRSLGEVYFRTLVSTLLQNYPVLTIGDLKHPAPLLRLQVALCYLRSYNDAKQRSVVEKTLTEFKRDYPGAIGHLQFAADAARDPMAATDLDDFDAAVIAGRKSDNAKREWLQCLQVVANTIARELAVFAEDPILFAPASSRSRSNNAWKDVVAFIQRADKPDSYQGLSRRPDEKLIELVAKVREEYCSAIDGIVKNGVSAEPSSVWIQQGYSRKAGWDFGDAPKNSDEAIAALQRLHAIEFVVTDETGPYTQGQTVVVIPSG